MQYHVDGDLVDATEASISVRDHGFRFGDAAVKRLRVYGDTIFQWDEQFQGLRDTCDTLGITDGLDQTMLYDRIEELLDVNGLRNAGVCVSITRGRHPPGDPVSSTGDPTIVITTHSLPRGGTSGPLPWDGPASLQTVRTRRAPPACHPGTGTTNSQLARVMARQELRTMATETPAEEALIRDLNDNVLTGASSAIFFVRDDGIHTPAIPGDDGRFPTRDIVFELAADEDIPTNRGTYDRNTLHAADEVFLANTWWTLRPVDTIDGIDFDIGPVTKLLTSRYNRLVETQCY